MADDDEKELKDQRVVTMMAPSELEAIDDWMFKNRIRSRGEAIRRLTAAGLNFEKGATDLLTKVSQQMEKASDALDRQGPVFAPLPDGQEIPRDHALELALASMDMASEYEDIVWSMLGQTRDLVRESAERFHAPLPDVVPVRTRFGKLVASLRSAIGIEPTK